MAFLIEAKTVQGGVWAADPGLVKPHVIIGAVVTLGGVLGGVACGLVSDRCFKSNRATPMLLFGALQMCVLLACWFEVNGYRDAANPFVVCILLFTTCFFLLGNYALLRYSVPTDLGPKVAGQAAGVATTVQYFSSGLAGSAMSALVESHGYEEESFIGCLEVLIGLLKRGWRAMGTRKSHSSYSVCSAKYDVHTEK